MAKRLLFLLLAAALVSLPALLWAKGQGEKTSGSALGACADCHASTDPKYPMLGEAARYELSGHRELGDSAYANGTGCQVCHTNEGFVSWTRKGDPDAAEFVREPSQPGCFTCHMPHEKGDFSLRTAAPVTLANGAVFDVARGNLCAACHHATAVAAKTVVATPANRIASYWGSHHGPQADIILGTNAYEFPGKKYGSSSHKDVINDGCISCHMSLPQTRAGLSLGIGGHSFMLAGKVHGVDTLNLSACIACHRDVKQVPGTTMYSIVAQEDYDRDGKKEPVQMEVQGLLDKFVNAGGTGILQRLNPPFCNKDGSFNLPRSETPRPVNEVGAFYNYRMIMDDRSLGIHNTKYVIQVLYDSLQAVDSQFDVSRRPK